MDRYQVYYNILEKWMRIREHNKSLQEYFGVHGYKTIAIYGLGVFARHLLYDLQNLPSEAVVNPVDIVFVFDKMGDRLGGEIKFIECIDDWPEVDAIIVTAVNDFHEIEKELSQKLDISIISIEEVITDVEAGLF